MTYHNLVNKLQNNLSELMVAYYGGGGHTEGHNL